MALEYVVTKRVFGFDKDKNEKYVAKSVRSGKVNFAKMCRKVSQLCGVHRKVVDLVVSGLVDKMAEDIDDGKSVQLGEFGIFSPTIRAKSADDEKDVSSKSIVQRKIIFYPGKIFKDTLAGCVCRLCFPTAFSVRREWQAIVFASSHRHPRALS